MQAVKNYVSKVVAGDFFHLKFLHAFNDGFFASILLLLPFIAQSQGLSLTQVGFLGTVLNAMSIAFAFPAGYLAARFGGLKVLVIAMFIYGAAFLATGATGNFWILIPVFILAGVGFGVFHPIGFALIAKWAPKEKRGRAMGDFAAIGEVGRIGITAMLSFLAVAIGWQQAAIFYALVALLTAALLYRYLISDKTKLLANKEKHQTTQNLPFWQILKNRRYVMTLCSGIFDCFANTSILVFLPFLLLKRNIDPAFLGAMTATFFVGTFFGKTLLGRFVDKWGGAKVFIVAEILMAAFIFLLASTEALPLIIVFSVILGIFTKGTVPVLQSMIGESVEHHGNYEKAFGFESLLSNIAMAAAPLAIGFISDQFGIINAFYAMAASALLAAIPAVAYFFTSNRASRSTQTLL